MARPRRRLITAAGLIGLIGAAALAAPPPSAIERFGQIRAQLARDESRSDHGAYLADAIRLSAFLNGSPTSVLEMARANLALGRRAEALAQTRRFLAMGQTHPILASTAFAEIAPALAPLIARNQAPILRAGVAWRLSDAGLVAEDIDFDPRSRRFFVTSILEHKIVALSEDGAQHDVAASPDGWPMVALKLDVARRRLWATEVAFDGFVGVDAKDRGRAAVLEYDIDTGALLHRLDAPAGAAIGDMALARDGDPILSDGERGAVYRLHGEVFHRIDHGDFISPQTPAVCSNGRRLFVPDYVRGLAALDLRTGRVSWISANGHYALNGVDGLYCRRGVLWATQNGASPPRVVAFRLNAEETAIVDERIIARATPGFDDPTHGVLVGVFFYFIANSGWDSLDDHGAVKPSTPLTSAVIMRAPTMGAL